MRRFEGRNVIVTGGGRGGGLAALVNNAGVDDDTPFLDVTVENWHRVLETNLSGAFFMGQRIAREMARTGGGGILHNASIDASGGGGTYLAYNASKAGMLGLNRTLASELAPSGIRANAG